MWVGPSCGQSIHIGESTERAQDGQLVASLSPDTPYSEVGIQATVSNRLSYIRPVHSYSFQGETPLPCSPGHQAQPSASRVPSSSVHLFLFPPLLNSRMAGTGGTRWVTDRKIAFIFRG